MGLCVYLASFFVLYPNFFSIADEGAYLSATNLVLQGKILVSDPLDAHHLVYSAYRESFVPGFQLGNAIIVLPFALLSWNFIFLSGLLLHLLNTFILAKIMRMYKLNKVYSLFYVLYPGLVFYSRTIMTEIPTITFTLLGFYFYLRNKKNDLFLAGFLWGISCLIRPTNALIIVAIIIYNGYKIIKEFIQSCASWKKDLKNLLLMCLGILPSFLLAIFFNYLIYDNFFATRHYGGGTGAYTQLLGFEFAQLLVYWKPLVVLLLIYPFMLAIPWFIKYKKKQEIMLILILFFFVLGKSDIIRYSWLINLVIGHRYFFPIIPLLLIPYSLFLKKYFKSLVSLFIVLLILMCPILMYKQHLYTEEKFELMETVYSIIPPDSIVVTTTDPQYFNSYFGDLNIISLKKFKKINYSGKYYLFYYHNQELFNNLRKEFSINDVASRKEIVKDYVEENGLDLFYEEGNLKIFSTSPD